IFLNRTLLRGDRYHVPNIVGLTVKADHPDAVEIVLDGEFIGTIESFGPISGLSLNSEFIEANSRTIRSMSSGSEVRIPSNKLLSQSALNAATTRHRSYKPKDQFDLGPTFPDLVGRTFETDISLKGDPTTNCRGTPEFNFSQEKSELSVYFGDHVDIQEY